jgi:hypothetical protein
VETFGWQFWLEESGRVRQFIVADPDEIKARELLRKKQPKGQILSRKIVPETSWLSLACHDEAIDNLFASWDLVPDPQFVRRT